MARRLRYASDRCQNRAGPAILRLGERSGELSRRLTELGEHTSGALGMGKGDLHAVGAVARGFVDEPDTGHFQRHKCCGEILDPVSDVVNAGAFLRQEIRDRAVIGGRLDQLDAHLADLKERHAHLLVGDLLNAAGPQAKHIAVENTGGLDRVDGDTQVVNL